MTKALTKAEKRDKKEARKQQKAASKTMKTVTQPKPADQGTQEAEPVNLCDDCAYEFGECEGKPKFASDQDKTLTGPEADRVIECPAFVNVAKLPTADQARKEAAAPGPAPAEAPGLVIPCSGGCGKTTESITSEATSGEFKEVGEGPVPQWTCQECLDKAAAESEPETQVIRKDLPELPDPKRFQAEEDFGVCPSCEMALKRTAFNRFRDAIRCTNGRCRAYRVIVKTVSTGVK